MISYAPQDKFVDFVKGLIDDYPEYRLRCVSNQKIENKVRQRMVLDRKIQKYFTQTR